MGYCIFTLCQMGWNLLLLSQTIAMGAGYMCYWIDLCYASEALQCSPNKWTASIYLFLVALSMFFFVSLECVVLKWLFVGRYKAGLY